LSSKLLFIKNPPVLSGGIFLFLKIYILFSHILSTTGILVGLTKTKTFPVKSRFTTLILISQWLLFILFY